VLMLALFLHKAMFGAKGFRSRKTAGSGRKSNLLSEPQRELSKAQMAVREFHEPVATSVVLMLAKTLSNVGSSTVALELQEALVNVSWADAQKLLARALQNARDSVTTDALSAVRDIVASRGQSPSTQVADQLLHCYMRLELEEEFDTALAQICHGSGGISALMPLRAAVRADDFDLACTLFKTTQWVPSTALLLVLKQFSRMASRSGNVDVLLRTVCGASPCSEIFEAVVSECVPVGDRQTCREVERALVECRATITSEMYVSLIQGYNGADDAKRIIKVIQNKGLDLEKPLLASVHVASNESSTALAEFVLERLPRGPPQSAAWALLHFYVKLRTQQSRKTDESSASKALLQLFRDHFRRVDLEHDIGRQIVDAALELGRHDIVEEIVSRMSDPEQMNFIKGAAATRGVAGASAVFQSCRMRTACHHNTLLDTCVERGDLEAAERVMGQARQAGVANVITYNTLVKAHLRAGSITKARDTVAQMRRAGLEPNTVTFNELLDATLVHKPGSAWSIIEEMKSCGATPNHITCSILLKNIHPRSSGAAEHIDLKLVVSLVGALDTEIDEILLGSSLEACMRAGQTALLPPLLKRQQNSTGLAIRNSYTFGILIRANGLVGDLAGVWDTWRAMKARRVAPTSIALGCMVEALSTNDDPEAGYELIHAVQAEEDPQTATIVNAVIYCSVLKGLLHLKRFERMWEVYEEMLAKNVGFQVVTYNVLMDACARSGDMSKVTSLLADMDRQGVTPSLITYSTLIKGYCQEGNLEKAFELLETMQHNTDHKPEEFCYNALLSGCVRLGMFDRGFALLKEMERTAVKPSQCTLAISVKLMSQAKGLKATFDLCDEYGRKHNIWPNVQVYNNLIHSCVMHSNVAKAMDTFEEMLQSRIRPDTHTYTLLLRSCRWRNDVPGTVGLLRAALGLSDVPSRFAAYARFMQPPNFPAKPALDVLDRWCTGPSTRDPILLKFLQDWKCCKPKMASDTRLQAWISRAESPHG